MSQEQLLARLEAAVAKLEALGVGGGAPAAKKGDEMDDASSDGLRFFMDYETFAAANLPKFFGAFDAFADLARHKVAFEKAWANQLGLVKAAALCKKPSDADLLAFLAPSVACMDECSKTDRDAKNLNLQKALNEAVQFLSYPFNPPTFAHVEAMRDASAMWTNRALKDAKEESEEKLAQVRAFSVAIRDTLTEFAKFLKEYFKGGLAWNMSGKDFKAWSTGASAAPAAAVAKPAAPVAAAAAKPAAPVGNPLAGLNQGLAVTSGLKKVTDDMKTKNQKDLPPVEAPKPKVVAKTEPVASKPASLNQVGDNWFCEWQWNQQRVEIQNVQQISGVYIGKARNSNIYITGKPKSLTIDGAFRTAVFIPEFITSLELVNCDRVTVYVSGEGGNTYAIDKSKGCIINFSDAALAKDPSIITSNISECNIQNEKGDDLIEVAIPEQYNHKIVKNTGKGGPYAITAEAVTHG
jgi:adenylyl cyclase-associated protein